jgi:hypothetical protein
MYQIAILLDAVPQAVTLTMAAGNTTLVHQAGRKTPTKVLCLLIDAATTSQLLSKREAI